MKWKWFFIQRSKIVTKETERADNKTSRNAIAIANEHKTQASHGKWEKVAEWLYWALIEAGFGYWRLSRVLSFCFLSSGWKLIGMNFLWPENKQTQRSAEEAQTFWRVPHFSWIQATKLCRHRKAKIFHSWTHTSSMKSPTSPSQAESPSLSFFSSNTLIKVSVILQLLFSSKVLFFSVYPSWLTIIKTHLPLAIWF